MTARLVDGGGSTELRGVRGRGSRAIGCMGYIPGLGVGGGGRGVG